MAARLVTLPDADAAGLDLLPLSPEFLVPGVDAVGLFGPGGELIAWEGSHQGPVPRNARLGLSPYIYAESALFGYLYVTRPLPEGTGTAVAVSLLRSDLPATLEDASADFVSRFLAHSGARIQVGREDRVEGEAAWGLTWEREVLFSVAVVPASEAEARARVEQRWGWFVALLLVATWVGVTRAIRWTRGGADPVGRRPRAGPPCPGASLGEIAGNSRLFSPADSSPGPLNLTLGDLFVLGAAGVFLLGFVDPRPSLGLGGTGRGEHRGGAEDRIERLGTRPDPFLEFLLLRTGEEARDLSLVGRNPVEVLYGAWAGSGLAREGVPVWLTWWSPDGFAQEELRIGVSTPRPAIPAGSADGGAHRGEVASCGPTWPNALRGGGTPVPGRDAHGGGTSPPRVRRRLAPRVRSSPPPASIPIPCRSFPSCRGRLLLGDRSAGRGKPVRSD
jgi:hypothetical protein